MISKKDMKEVVEIFRSEAVEIIDRLGDQFIAMEKAPTQKELSAAAQTAFRYAHNLKGAAAAADFETIIPIVHALEDSLDAVRENAVSPSAEMIDALFASLELIRETARHSSPGAPKREGDDARRVVDRLCFLFSGKDKGKDQNRADAPDAPTPTDEKERPERETRASESDEKEDLIRISQHKLDSLLNYLGELVEMKIRMEETLGTVRRVEEELTGLDGEQLKSPYKRIQNLSVNMASDVDYLGKLLSGIQDDLKEARVAKIGAVFPLLRRTVRDVARKQRLKVDFHAQGEDIELDRKIIERIKNPLIHLIRNAVYHGLESSTLREKAGKPPVGRLWCLVSGKGNTVRLEIGDDGRGIDFEKISAKARQKGLFPETKEPTEAELVNLLFSTGVSTAHKVDEIAGRGVGLDVVKKAVEGLRGSVKVDTRPGEGTVFILSLPQILASNIGVLIHARSSKFVIPRQSVERAIFFTQEKVIRSNNRCYLRYNERSIPLAVLGPSLELFDYPPDRGESMAVVIHSAELSAALVIDHIQAETEIMVRDLGKLIRRIPKISGVTISSSGEMLFVLEPADLIRQLYERAGEAATRTSQAGEAGTPPVRTVLVVDDSVTSRNVTQKMLSNSGYEVITAADGVQALERLEQSRCDLVLSDVNMPNMDGYGLARRIKAKASLRHIPVVLLSSLSGENDKILGLESGADAYLVKGELTHSKLIETINNLM